MDRDVDELRDTLVHIGRLCASASFRTKYSHPSAEEHASSARRLSAADFGTTAEEGVPLSKVKALVRRAAAALRLSAEDEHDLATQPDPFVIAAVQVIDDVCWWLLR